MTRHIAVLEIKDVQLVEMGKQNYTVTAVGLDETFKFQTPWPPKYGSFITVKVIYER